MTTIEEMLSFVAEVLQGVLVHFCLKREVEIHHKGKYLV